MESVVSHAPSPTGGRADENDRPDVIPGEDHPANLNPHQKSNDPKLRCDNTSVGEPEEEDQSKKKEQRRSNPSLDGSAKAAENKSKRRLNYSDQGDSDGCQATASASARQGVFVYPDTTNSGDSRRSTPRNKANADQDFMQGIEDMSPESDLFYPEYGAGPEALREYQARLVQQEKRNKEMLMKARRESGWTG